MGIEENKIIASRYFEEFWNKGNTAIVDELCAPDVHVYAPLVGDFNGRAAVKGFIGSIHDAIEGYHFDMTRPLVAEGDTVLCCWHANGVVKKDIGFFPGNGTTIDFTGVAIYKIVDGLIHEEFTEEDGMKVFRQLGLLML
jgi:predicted ester cyclase